MLKRLMLSLLLLLPMTAAAQVSITATHVVDAFERPLAGAKLCFAPVDATATPTGFRVGSVQVVTGAVCGLISNGALQPGLSIAPGPSGVYYHVWVASRANEIVRDYGMTPITGTTWSLDTYDPTSMAVLPQPVTIGTVTTLASNASPTASITGTGPYLLNLGIPQGASPNVTMGTVTTLSAGATATAQIVGTAPNFTVNLSIPQGAQGTQGVQGATGPQGATAITGMSGDGAGNATLTGTLTSGAMVLGGTGDLKASTCRPVRGAINIQDCGVVSSTVLNQTSQVKTAMQAARTYSVPLLLPGGMTVDICNLTLDSSTNQVALIGPGTSGGGGGAAAFTFQATSTCTAGPTVSGTPLIGGVLFDGYSGGGFQRANLWQGITFDLRNVGIHAFFNYFGITNTYKYNTFSGMKADGGQGLTPQNRSTYIYDDLAEYNDYNYNYFQGSKGYAFYATNCNRCTTEHNLIYTQGGVGFFGGYAMTSTADDWEGVFSNPWDTTNSIWEMGLGTFTNEISNMYMEVINSATCGLVSASVTSNVATVVANCNTMSLAVGNYVGLAGTHTIDANNSLVSTVTVNSPVSGQTTITYPLTHADAAVTTYSITGFPTCNSYPNVANVCYATLSTVPTGLRAHDWITISGTGTCADGSNQTQVINGTTIGVSLASACAPTTTATGTAVFGAVRGGQSINNPTLFWARQNYGTIKLHGNYANFGTVPANFGAVFVNSINPADVSSNTVLRADAVFSGPSNALPPAGSQVSGNYANDVDSTGSYGLGIMTLLGAADTQGAAWLGDLGASYYTAGHRHAFYGGPINQCAYEDLSTSVTWTDLGTCNIHLISSTNAATISTVYNAKVPQVDNVQRSMPGYFTFEAANGNTTLANAQFNNASGANFPLPANRPVLYQVGYNGVVREVGAWSTMLSQSAGRLWYSDGAKPVSVALTGFVKANTSGAPTAVAPSGNGTAVATTSVTTDSAGQSACWDGVHNLTNSGCSGGSGGTFFSAHLTGQTASIGNTTITTVGGARQCFIANSVIHTTTVGTSGTVTSAFGTTIDGTSGINVGQSSSVTATAAPNNGASLGLNTRYFCADAGAAVYYFTTSTAAGGHVYNLDVSLQAVP
jgi:hypothetical protein